METITKSQQRAVMPSGANAVLDRRSVQNDYKSLLAIVKEGMRVLDVGCGSGAITKGMAELVGANGSVIGIDTSSELIEQARQSHKDLSNLSFEHQNIFEYQAAQKFDLIASARTLQWLSNPMDALIKMKSLVKPGGIISILDYNHEKIEWQPSPPDSMKFFYAQFLAWRQDAGMNNRMADDLFSMFSSAGLKKITMEDASELCSIEDVEFLETAGIWKKVAETRGQQMVRDGYITEQERLSALNDYAKWLEEEGQSMTMYLRAVTGYNQ
jgi:ubiquinone/menaquinone biosynthesis C-methylase UbiE